MADYDLFQIEITRNYTKNEWREDVKKVFIMIHQCPSLIFLSEKSWYFLYVTQVPVLANAFSPTEQKRFVFGSVQF